MCSSIRIEDIEKLLTNNNLSEDVSNKILLLENQISSVENRLSNTISSLENKISSVENRIGNNISSIESKIERIIEIITKP